MPAPLRRALLAGALAVVTAYPLLALQVYLPAWYELGCRYHRGCETLGRAVTRQGITELTRYWRHQGSLGTIWSATERRHLAQVRTLYDRLLLLFLAAAGALAVLFRRRDAAAGARLVVLALLPLFLVLPVFGSFWTDVFHPLVFQDRSWVTRPGEVSYALLPRRFFLVSTGALLTGTLAINLALWLWLGRAPARARDGNATP